MEKCKWTAEESTGDLIFYCPGKNKQMKIIREVVQATSHATTNSHSIVVEELKQKIEETLGCHECEKYQN